MRGLIGLAMIVAMIAAHPLLAQSPPAETCGPGTDLGPWDELPWSGTISVADKDFVMTGAGCVEVGGPDAVVTFTTSSTCRIDAWCSDGTFSLFEGPCVTQPASCLNAMGLPLMDFEVEGLQMYCIVCALHQPGSLQFSIQEAPGWPEHCGEFVLEGLLFWDDFETGGTGSWSEAVGGQAFYVPTIPHRGPAPS